MCAPPPGHTRPQCIHFHLLCPFAALASNEVVIVLVVSGAYGYGRVLEAGCRWLDAGDDFAVRGTVQVCTPRVEVGVIRSAGLGKSLLLININMG